MTLQQQVQNCNNRLRFNKKGKVFKPYLFLYLKSTEHYNRSERLLWVIIPYKILKSLSRAFLKNYPSI